MPRRWRSAASLSGPESQLKCYCDAIFRPIVECARGKRREDVVRVCRAFFEKYCTKHLDGKSGVASEEGLKQAVREIRTIDLLNAFCPYEHLAGYGIGEEYSCRWNDALCDVYPRSLAEERITKAREVFDHGDWASLNDDFSCKPSSRDHHIDPEGCLVAEIKWLSELLPALRAKYDNFHGAPPHIIELDRRMEQYRADCIASLAECRRLQRGEDQELWLKQRFNCGSILGWTASQMHAEIRRYFGCG